MSFTKMTSGKNIKIQAARRSERIKTFDSFNFLSLRRFITKTVVRSAGKPQRMASCQKGVDALTKPMPSAIEEKFSIKGRVVKSPTKIKVKRARKVRTTGRSKRCP